MHIPAARVSVNSLVLVHRLEFPLSLNLACLWSDSWNPSPNPPIHTHTITRRTCQVHTKVWRPEVGTEPSAFLQRADATVPPIFLNLSERIYPYKKWRKCILKPSPVINSRNSVVVYPSAHLYLQSAPASFCPAFS